MLVDYVQLQVGNGNANNAAGIVYGIFFKQGSIGHVYGRLSYAVHIDELWPLIAVSCKPRFQPWDIERFTAEDHQAQCEVARCVGRFIHLHELTKCGRRLI